MHKKYEVNLPDGYSAAYVLDAKRFKTAFWMNIVVLLIAAAIMAASWFIIQPQNFFQEYSLPRNLYLIAAMFIYIILHELAHGAAYKALTHRKLKFGFTLTVAYCGVPDIYVYRRTALIALLTPFFVFIPVFLIPAFLFTNGWDQFYAMFLFAMHISGCAGDLYDTALLLFKFRDPATLLRDTGPKQTFYTKS